MARRTHKRTRQGKRVSVGLPTHTSAYAATSSRKAERQHVRPAPTLLVLLALLGNSARVMGKHRLGRVTTGALLLTALLLVVAVGLLVFGLVTGQT